MMARPCRIDPEGNVSFSLAFRLSLGLISLLIGIILTIFGFMGSKALAEIDNHNERISTIEGKVGIIFEKVSYIKEWTDKH